MNANLMSMLINFFICTIVFYVINISYDIRKRTFKKSIIYLPNIIDAVLASIALNIFKWGLIPTFILIIVIKFLLDSAFGEE
jgi:hypothetical protein